MIDEKIQNCFYAPCCHRNTSQMPHWCKSVAKYSIAVPITIFGLEALFSSDVDHKTTGRIFLLGMPFVIFGKDLIKRAKFDACLRPWNQHFSREKRAHGGFPSGHMAEASYIAVLYGMRYGPKYAIPLGLMATFLGAAFLNCNRHYISQLVAGVGLGTLYALAANKLINARLHQDLHLNVGCDKYGSPCLDVSYDF
jgi:membrane-associated phospholipid phosphatase